MSSINLLIISDSERHRELRTQAAACSDISVVGTIVESAALHLAAALRPDAVLLDGAASSINPFVALGVLQTLPDAPRVVYLAATPSAAERRLALELGAVAVAAPGNRVTLHAALGVGRDLTRLSRPLVGRRRAA
jgi:DNA-binding NarL/FixJ family response regulator